MAGRTPVRQKLLNAAAEHLSFLLEGAMSRAGLEGHDARLKAARRIAASMLDRLEGHRQ